MKNSHPWRRLLIAACVLVMAAPGCTRRSESGAFVARVNNQYLTPEKVAEDLDTRAGATEPKVRDFVTEWINSALLYEEAKSRGLDRSADVNEILEEMRRQLAVNQLLEKEVYTDQSVEVSDEEIKGYYDQHKGDYLLAEDVANIRFVRFTNRDAAASFRGQLLKGKPWSEVLQGLSVDSAFATALVERVDSLYVKRSTFPSSELWRTVTQLRINEFSPVIKDEMGYYVAALLGLQLAGEIAELPVVASDTHDRVLVEKRQKALSQFLERLKNKYAVQVNLAALETDDTAKLKR